MIGLSFSGSTVTDCLTQRSVKPVNTLMNFFHRLHPVFCWTASVPSSLPEQFTSDMLNIDMKYVIIRANVNVNVSVTIIHKVPITRPTNANLTSRFLCFI